MKKFLLIAVIILAAVAGFYAWQTNPAPKQAPEISAKDFKNISYNIDGKPVALVEGRSEAESAPGSASKIVTQYFGNDAVADVNGDGPEDVVFLLTQDGGGSGTFFYVVAALRVPETAGYSGTNAVFLGDRIAPQNTNVSGRLIMVNYAERKPGEPMTARPSVGVTKYLIVENGELHELNIDKGYVVMGEGVRTFTPCGSKEAWWLIGTSTAYKDIMASYLSNTRDVPPSQYKPIFSLIVGRKTGAPQDGFGADYESGYVAFKLLNMSPRGSCE